MIWPHSKYLSEYEKLYDDDPLGEPNATTKNFQEIMQHRHQITSDMSSHEPWDIDELAFRNEPERIIKITISSFDLDYFQLDGANLVSAKARKALALSDDAIVYRTVDTSQSAPTVRAKEYQAFFPRKVADFYDPDRMPGAVRPVRQSDGSMKEMWILDPPDELGIPKPIPTYVRPGFVPPAPIFRPRASFTVHLVTDELAQRVMRAGVTGIGFRDIVGKEAAEKLIYREE